MGCSQNKESFPLEKAQLLGETKGQGLDQVRQKRQGLDQVGQAERWRRTGERMAEGPTQGGQKLGGSAGVGPARGPTQIRRSGSGGPGGSGGGSSSRRPSRIWQKRESRSGRAGWRWILIHHLHTSCRGRPRRESGGLK